jgi:hypothetical protein
MPLVRPVFITLLLLGLAAPAYADFTFIIGSNRTPSSRTVKGFAVGGGGMIATEFEYVNNGEDLDDEDGPTPGLRTFLGNVLLQTPFPIAGFQPYGLVGTGIYRETLDTHRETAWAFHTGLGVKRRVFGPFMVRFDYRVLNLRGEPLHSKVHRVYTGFHFAF